MDKYLELYNKIKSDIEVLTADRDRLLLEYNNVLNEEQVSLDRIEKEMNELYNIEWKRRDKATIKMMASFPIWVFASGAVSLIISDLAVVMRLFATLSDATPYVIPVTMLLGGALLIKWNINHYKKHQEGFKKYDADVAVLKQNKKECKDRINKALSEYEVVVVEISKKEQFLREIDNFDSSIKEVTNSLNSPLSRKLVREEE